LKTFTFKTMFSKTLLVSAAFAVLVSAQSTDPALGIKAAEAHFQNAGLVPALLATFEPVALLDANYAGVGDIQQGQKLTKDQVGPAPTFTVVPANSSVKLDGNYTLAMVDAGPVGSDQSAGQTRHWLVNGLTISGGKFSNSSAVAITEYAGPAPPAGSGPHRYVFLLYAQPSTFSPPSEFSQPNIGVSVFNVNDYAKNSNLGPVVAGSYITVEEGTASASLSATSAVVTSTLAASSASGSGSTKGGASGTSSGQPAKSTNGAGVLVKGSPVVLAFAMVVAYVL
jgi:hypothetical protein